MSALARWFQADDHVVLGYDRTSTELTKALESEGIKIDYNETLDFIPDDATVRNTLVVYTPAVPEKISNFNILKRIITVF